MLAYFYHWSDDVIKRLPRTRREIYCEKVRTQIDAENGKINKNPLKGQDTSPLKHDGKEYKESKY